MGHIFDLNSCHPLSGDESDSSAYSCFDYPTTDTIEEEWVTIKERAAIKEWATIKEKGTRGEPFGPQVLHGNYGVAAEA